MILNTGNRTDIPAFFSEWFYNRIQAGTVLVRNPYYSQQVIKYRLSPEVVDCLAFCTKNPEPMLERLGEIRTFKQYWFVTITPYGRDIEPHVPDSEQVMQAFRQLSDAVSLKSIGWRYDPIFISKQYPLAFHLESFERMASGLSGYTDHCVISFIDLYKKTLRNFQGVQAVTAEERQIIGQAFAAIARKYKMTLRTCCEGTDLQHFEVDCSGCMTQAVLERAIGTTLKIPRNRHETRDGCDCLLGSDIGVYNTCGHGCLYCYANHDNKSVRHNMANHDAKSPFLIGGFMDGDIIKEAKQVSYVDGQLRLF
ncbi:DUF1848 domain-containing protein [Acetobacterium bakii]|uniref:DUF1848 domain-containing protein n=1 Tax=Acetobacterium bakii TaxID=52689 RepID=A0A0L6U1D5_9FIRM|nr:DUF1848 domain-containing protein [Acetobacterium bakii]KNZ42318.1 hypothetical protein AKG39_07345 [Acetobacterium bakii]